MKYRFSAGLEFTVEEEGVRRDVLLALKTYVEESAVRFLTGDLDVDRDWDKYVEDVKKLDVDKVIDIYTKVIAERAGK